MIKRTSKMIIALVLVIAIVGTMAMPAFGTLAGGDTIEYPFRKADAFANAPTWKGATAQASGDSFYLAEVVFDGGVQDLSQDSYVAIEIQNVKGNPGMTFGLLAGNNRWGTYTDGRDAYFVKQDGSVQTLSILYSSINLGTEPGMLLLPISSLSAVSWGDGTPLSSAKSFFMETNSRYNWDWEVKIGEVGVYNGEIGSGTFRKLTDLSSGTKEGAYVCYAGEMIFPEPVTDSKYPFRQEDAFTNAPTWQGPVSQDAGDTFYLAEVLFDDGALDISKATYVGIEIQNVKGNPGMTFGVLAGKTRWGTYIDGESKAYFVKQDGTVQNLNILYSSINLGNEPGMLLLPISSLSNVGWSADDLTIAHSFFMETNGKYNWNWEIKLGEVGLYTGELGTDTFRLLTEQSSGVKKGSYVCYAGKMNFPEEEAPKVDIAGKTVSYPFATGLTAFNGAIRWTGPSAGDSAVNWQTMFVSFDTATADLSDATYLVVQYKATAGSPGLTYGIESGSSRYSIGENMDGNPIYFISEDGKISKNGDILWGASNVSTGTTGALLIPMSSMGCQWGTDDLTTVKNFLMTTNSQYNWNFEVVIGEIGYYTGDPTDGGEFHKLLDLSAGAKEDKFFVTSDNADNRGYKSVYKVDIADLGDTHIDVFATGKQDNSLPVYVNGALGTQTMTKDSYGDDAFKLVTPGPRDGATDPYAAFTLIDGANFQWAGQKGITFWVRNDSDKEISFNLEFDMNHNDYTNTAGGHNARFNIRQGHRFWLYDVKTGEQQIYMTRPCVTIPAGFEGWVRIPFEAYEQADWSAAGQGVFNKSLFAAEGSWVQYMCITVNSQDYANKEFSIGKIGTYSTTPYLVSAWFEGSETHKTIPQLMGLEE